MNIPRLVGHRGYPRHFPENTLCGLDATLPGACFVEIDVQLTMDRVPVVIHDATLARTAGIAGDVRDMRHAELARFVVDERARLGRPFPHACLPSLKDVVGWLRHHRTVAGFVEVKGESLARFGCTAVIERVVQDLSPLGSKAVVISFDADAIMTARRLTGHPVGWVLAEWSDQALAQAARLAPQFLFCDHTAIPASVSELPDGPWQWVLYDITDPGLALDWAGRGAALIETGAIGEMLAHPLLRRRACGG